MELWDSQAEFSERVFGKGGPLGPLAHLQEEAREVFLSPHDLSEYADCYLLLCDALRRAGYTLADLINAAENKHGICKNSEWVQTEQGYWKRVK